VALDRLPAFASTGFSYILFMIDPLIPRAESDRRIGNYTVTRKTVLSKNSVGTDFFQLWLGKHTLEARGIWRSVSLPAGLSSLAS
jgi:hypothetical protein